VCTSILVSKAATRNDINILSRNEDFTQNNWNKYLMCRPIPEYGTGGSTVVTDGIWTLGNGLKVPVPSKQFRYSATPDAVGESDESTYSVRNHYFFEERGINEKNVAISATNSLSINDRANAVDPLLASGGIAECILPTLLLPQVETARDTIRLLGDYLAQYGASEVNGILIGDPAEVWYFEIGSCHQWIAVKVPPNCYLVVANGMRVHSVDLENTEEVLHSPQLFEFVKKHGLLDNPNAHDFNFAQAFGIPGVAYNENRIWLAQSLLTPSRTQSPYLYQYPLFLEPDDKVDIVDVMRVLRATYAGTVLEGLANRPIGYDRTAESHILTLDTSMPGPLQGLIWQAISTPLGAPYIPLYNVLMDIPKSYSAGDNVYDTTSAYWAFRGLYALGHLGNGKYLAQNQALWAEHEKRFIEEHKHVNDMLRSFTAKPEGEEMAAACEFASNYSTGALYQMVDVAQRERNRLMTEITKMYTCPPQ